MPTPSRYNYFELFFKIIVILMVLAINITVFVLKVNDARHSHPIVKHTASRLPLWEKAGFYVWNARGNNQQVVALNNRVILINNTKAVALDGQTGKELERRLEWACHIPNNRLCRRGICHRAGCRNRRCSMEYANAAWKRRCHAAHSRRYPLC